MHVEAKNKGEVSLIFHVFGNHDTGATWKLCFCLHVCYVKFKQGLLYTAGACTSKQVQRAQLSFAYLASLPLTQTKVVIN